MRSQPNYFEVVLFRRCFFVVVIVDVVFVIVVGLYVFFLLFVTLFADLRLLLIEVEFGW